MSRVQNTLGLRFTVAAGQQRFVYRQTKNGGRMIWSERGVHMWLVELLRKSKCELFYYRAAIMCVATLSVLLVRSAPPSLPEISLGITVHSFPDHQYRLSFDQQDFQWWARADATQPSPPPVVAPHLSATAPPFLEIERNGWHFNRPPPVS